MPLIGNIPIPIIFTEGGPRERGREHGSVARETIQDSVSQYMARFAHFSNVDQEGARAAAADYVQPIRSLNEDLLVELEGVADGAGVHFLDLLAVNCRSELMFGRTALDCTSFAAMPSATIDGRTYVGQNWDWAPSVESSLILLVIKQDPGPTIILLNEAGMIGRNGYNSSGLGVGSNTLIAGSRATGGVPYNVVLRHALNQTKLADAIGAVVRVDRTMPANYVIASREGLVVDIEASVEFVDSIEPRNGVITHGNHFEGSRQRGRDKGLDRFPDSLYRSCRLRDCLTPHLGRLSNFEMRRALADRTGEPSAISRTGDERLLDHDQLATVASVIWDVTEGTLWLAKGAPHMNEYWEFSTSDLCQGQAKPSAVDDHLVHQDERDGR